MKEQILKLEKESRKLETSTLQRAKWNKAVTDYADDFIENIFTNKAFIVGDLDSEAFDNIDFNEAVEIETAIDFVKEKVDKIGLNPASGGHLGYIPGGGLFPSALGDYIAAVGNRYAGIYFGGPGAVKIENSLIAWMAKVMGYPSTAHGNLTSGGSIANLIAITTARDFKEILPEKVRSSVIYLTKQVHHCVQKAIRICGLEHARIEYIPLDAHFRMDMDKLKERIIENKAEGLSPFLLVGSAGTTDTGAVDPMQEMAMVCKESDIWFHVDAAYGGFFILCEEHKEKFKGIELSDSLVIDPHKGLFLSYGLGTVLVKNKEALYKSHYYQANYMQDTLAYNSDISPADVSPELTKHFRGMRLWLPLRLFGLKPFIAGLSEKILLCRYFYDEIQKLGFDVGPYPDLSVMIFKYPSKENEKALNERIVEHVKTDGRVFLSSTNIDGVYWIRMAPLAFRTHLDTIDTCLEVISDKLKEEGLLS